MKNLKYIPGMQITYFLCMIVIMYSCSSSRKASNVHYNGKWINSSIPGHNYASFEDLEGVKTFQFRPALQKNLVIKYHATLADGKLNIEIRSSLASLFKATIADNVQDSLLINVAGNEKYYVMINGTHASGTFDIIYKAGK